MKRTLISIALAAVSGAALAAGFQDTAEVISAVPVYERVSTPRQECSEEIERVSRPVHRDEVVYRDSRDVPAISGGTVLGAVIGGVVGRQFGNSSGGRDRGTAAGAILGGILGNQIERDSYRDGRVVHREYGRTVDYRPVTQCRTVSDYRDEVRGYDVTYRYNGRDYRTRMPYDPGRTMQVAVDVRPDRGGPGQQVNVPDYRYEPRGYVQPRYEERRVPDRRYQ